MLTTETLKQNSALSGLTDAQLTAIAEMSQNDENAALNTKISALHTQYDAEILAATGIAKNSDEKSYDYAKRVLASYKSNADSASALVAAKKEVEDLKAKIAAGSSDDALKTQLKDSKNQVSQLQAQLAESEKTLTSAKAEHEKQLMDLRVDYAFAEATKGVKFKAGFSEAVQQVLLNAAKAEILAKGKPDYIDGISGKILVIRDANGNVLNNPNNNLNPFTISELFMQSASIKDAIDTGKQQPGAGTEPNPKTESNGVIDFSGVKTQLEADKLIDKYLLANGLTRDSAKFFEQKTQLRKDNGINAMPIR